MRRMDFLSEDDKKIVTTVKAMWKKAYPAVRKDWLEHHDNMPKCEKCGREFKAEEVRKWQLHNKIHRQTVDEISPAKETVCLCVSCHKREKELYERPDGTVIEY